jgi:hypothetical protein
VATRTSSRAWIVSASALLLSCANPTPPPGGPPDQLEPRVVRIAPSDGDTAVKPKAVIVDFDEIISETPSGAPDLAGLVVISPKSGDVRVAWKRSRMEIRPKDGFRDSAVYSLLIRPGIADLRGNRLDSAISLVFTTGGPIPNTSVNGELFDWVAGKAAPGAIVEAVSSKDTTLVYVSVADSSGRFRMRAVPPGEYLLRGYLDRNTNRNLERSEAFDSLRITLTDTLFAELYAYIHDTIPARIGEVALQDSSRRLQVTFDKPLSVSDTVLPTQFVVRTLPDSQPLPITVLSVRSRLQQALVDSLAKVAAADSAAKAKAPAADTAKVDSAVLLAAKAREDSVARIKRRDSIAAAEAAAREERRLLALRGGRPLPEKDTTPPPVMKRPVPVTELLVQLDTALPPETRLLIEARDIVTLSGTKGSASRPLLTPKRDTTPPKKDTAATKKDSAPQPADTASAKRDTVSAPRQPVAPARNSVPPARDTVPPRRDLALPRLRQ